MSRRKTAKKRLKSAVFEKAVLYERKVRIFLYEALYENFDPLIDTCNFRVIECP